VEEACESDKVLQITSQNSRRHNLTACENISVALLCRTKKYPVAEPTRHAELAALSGTLYGSQSLSRQGCISLHYDFLTITTDLVQTKQGEINARVLNTFTLHIPNGNVIGTTPVHDSGRK